MISAIFSKAKRLVFAALLVIPQAAFAIDYSTLIAQLNALGASDQRSYELHEIYRGHINRDGIEDEVAIIRWYGPLRGQAGNAVIAFMSHEEGVSVPGSGQRWAMLEATQVYGVIKGVSFGRNAFRISGLKLGPSDPACCPSVKSDVTFRWTGSWMGFQQVIE